MLAASTMKQAKQKSLLVDGETIIHRSAFVSRTDDVAVIKIGSPSNSELNYKFRFNQLPDEVDDKEFIPGVSNNPDDYTVKGDNAVRGNKNEDEEQEEQDDEKFIEDEEEDEFDEFNTANYVEPFQVTINNDVLSYTTRFKMKWEGSLKAYTVISKIIPKGGSLRAENGWIHINDADEILIHFFHRIIP